MRKWHQRGIEGDNKAELPARRSVMSQVFWREKRGGHKRSTYVSLPEAWEAVNPSVIKK